jgi:glycerophosphoryl diester phosphodiesterase
MGYLGRSPIAFAHRGGALLWPENTLEAFENVVALGFRYIETDLHMTKDGAIVCFHDSTLDRTTDGRGRLCDHTLAELRALDPGYRFARGGDYPFRGKGLSIPTLEQALALHPDLRLNVDIKQAAPSMIDALWAEIDRLDAHERLLVASVEDRLVHDFRAIRPMKRMPTSPGIRGVLRFWAGVRTGLGRFERYGYDALQVPATYRGVTVVDRTFVEEAHAHGLHVHVWTIDEREEMERLLDLGVDGLMTDRPDVLKRVLVARGQWTASGAEE